MGSECMPVSAPLCSRPAIKHRIIRADSIMIIRWRALSCHCGPQTVCREPSKEESLLRDVCHRSDSWGSLNHTRRLDEYFLHVLASSIGLQHAAVLVNAVAHMNGRPGHHRPYQPDGCSQWHSTMGHSYPMQSPDRQLGASGAGATIIPAWCATGWWQSNLQLGATS